MKTITPLSSNPVGWAEQVARTKLRVFSWILIHIGLVAAGLAAIYWLLPKPHVDSALTPYLFLAGAGPIVFIGIWYPAMYLYAMYRLLKIIKEAEPDEKISL